MQEQTVTGELEDVLQADTRSPCKEGMLLLHKFAKKRPADFAFLLPQDLVDRSTSAFRGIPEWDDFAAHCGSCGRCNVWQ
jgi:hypothetical protein